MLIHFRPADSTPGIYIQQHHSFGCEEIAEDFNITWRYLSTDMYVCVSCCSLLIILLSVAFLSFQWGTCGAEWSWPKELLHMYLNGLFHKQEVVGSPDDMICRPHRIALSSSPKTSPTALFQENV